MKWIIAESQNNNSSKHVEENYSNKEKPKLFDSFECEYTLHRSTSAHITWRCVIRNKNDQMWSPYKTKKI